MHFPPEITNNRSRTIVFKSFLEFGVEIDKPTKSKIHPLLVAVWLCNEEIVNTILERGTTVDDDRFVAILARAIRHDQTEIVKLMLKSRPCVNPKIELKRKKAIVDGMIFDCINYILFVDFVSNLYLFKSL